MTTLEAEIILMKMWDIKTHLIVPTITTMSTLLKFEADMCVLTKSNLATVVEIKVSASDLKADLKKKHIKALTNNKTGLKRYFPKIKHFYYAVPKELIEKAKLQIPDFAGLINLSNQTIIKQPKLIYNYKWTAKERLTLARLGTMRILGLKTKIFNLKKK